jgi:hypothetical protein
MSVLLVWNTREDYTYRQVVRNKLVPLVEGVYAAETPVLLSAR